MKFVTAASLLSLLVIASAHPSAIPEDQNVAIVEDTPETVAKDKSGTDSFDLDNLLAKLLADLPKSGKKSGGEKGGRPKFDFNKMLDELVGDTKKGADKKVDFKDLFGDLKGLDFKGLLDGLLKNPEAEREKVEV